MSLAVSNLKYESAGSEALRRGRLDFDASYPTGGETLTAASLALTNFSRVVVHPKDGYSFETVYAGFHPSSVAIKVLTGGGSAGSVLLTYPGGDIKGSANTNSENVDADTNPTNGALLKALDTFTNYAGTITVTINPDRPRNVAIVIANDSGGALDLFEGVTSFTVNGFYRGIAQTEIITITSTAGNKSVANTKFRYKYGVKPFSVVSNVTYTNAPAGALKASLGIGSLMGLPNLLKTPAEADVTNITKNGAFLAVTGLVSPTNNTVNLGVLADNDDFEITYNTASGGEVEDGADLSSLTAVEFDAYGF